jgi:hypothetical protein
MEKLILFTLTTLLVNPLFSQTWQTRSGGDDFDGNYKIASIQGVGEEFPYNEPAMAFIKWDNQEDYSFYISDADFLQPNTGIEIIFVFDNEPGVLYRTYPSSLSADGKTSFFNGFTNSEDLVNYSKYEILQKLMTASTVSVRFSDRFGQNDTSFNLSGSTKAINFVIPENELTALVEKAINDRNDELNKENKKQEQYENLIKYVDDIKLTDLYKSIFESELKRDLGLSLDYYTKSYAEDIDKIVGKADFESSKFYDRGEIKLFYLLKDGTEKEIVKIPSWQVSKDSPFYRDAEDFQQKIVDAKEDVKNKLSKYKFQSVIDEIYEKLESIDYNFKWTNLQDVKVLFVKSYGNIKIEKIMIYKKDGTTYESSAYLSTDLKNKDIKEIGAKLGELF